MKSIKNRRKNKAQEEFDYGKDLFSPETDVEKGNNSKNKDALSKDISLFSIERALSKVKKSKGKKKLTKKQIINVSVISTIAVCLIVAITVVCCIYIPKKSEDTGEFQGTEGLEYAKNRDGTYEVTGIGDCTETDIVISPYYKGKKVTSIGNRAFYRCSKLTSVTIPDSVTSIDDWAFYDCSSLVSITIPSSVTSIGYYAFKYCDSITSVYYGGSADEWSSISIDYGNTELTPARRYYYVENESEIPADEGKYWHYVDGVPTIYTYFKGLKYSETSDDTCAVVGIGTCVDKDIVISSYYNNKKVTSIGAYAFSGCSSLTSIIIPSSVTSIGSSAFYDCNSLTSIIIPSSVTSIGSSAFNGCSSLTSIYYVGNVNEWNEISIYYNNSALTDGICYYYVENESEIPADEGKYWHYVDGVPTIYTYFKGLKYSENSDGTYAVTGIGTCTDTDVIISSYYNGKKVTSIGESAFYNCSKLTSITIPNSVTTIGESAFYNCTSITSITIPNSLTTLFYNTFCHCSSLTSIVIPSSVTTIADDVFYGCLSLTSVTIPSSVTSIDDEAFYNCTALTSVYYIGTAELWNAISIGTSGNDGLTNATRYYYVENESDLPNDCGNYWHYVDGVPTVYSYSRWLEYSENGDGTYTITGIGTCTSTKIFIGDDGKNVTSISVGAFDGCTSFTSMTISDSVTSIGDFAFYNCSSLTSVVLPSSLTSLGNDMFSGCSSLTSIVMPKNVTNIGNYAFYNCSALTTIYYGGNADEWSSVVIGASNDDLTNAICYYYVENRNDVPKDGGNYWYYVDGVPTIYSYSKGLKYSKNSDGTYAVTGIGSCTDKDIVIGAYYNGKKVTSIGNSAFSYCSSLTSITIPSSVTSIGSYAFYDCNSLTSIIIPSSVTTIGYEAFYNCRSLTSIIIPSSVTSIGACAFYDCNSLIAVYYGGSADDWKGVSVGSSNLDLTVNLYYYVENAIDVPTDGGNYWHYVDGVPSAYYSKGLVYEEKSDGTYAVTGIGTCTDTDVIISPYYNGKQVTSIGDSAFSGCSSLISIVIPDSVTNIGNYAFSGCGSLTSIVIPNNVTLIGNYAFAYCASLGSIAIPDGVTAIGDRAFISCTSLTSVIIPESVTSVGSYAFYGCEDITIKGIAGSYAETYAKENGIAFEEI